MSDNIINSFNDLTSKVEIPIDIKSKSIVDTDKIMNSPFTKENMLETIENVSYSLKVQPLSYVDERRFYTCVDSCYKIYEQMITQKDIKYSRSFAWIVANVAMFSFFFKIVKGDVLSGREVERLVDLAIRSPTYFMIKYTLYGLVQFVISSLPGILYMTDKIPSNTITYHLAIATLSFYIISVIINLIKVSFKIRKAEVTELDAIKPTL